MSEFLYSDKRRALPPKKVGIDVSPGDMIRLIDVDRGDIGTFPSWRDEVTKLAGFVVPTSLEENATPEPWGDTTDPAQHDPQDFRYLVHAINPYAASNALDFQSRDAQSGIENDPAWGDQSISLFNEPERAAERVSLSTSLVDAEHTATWGEGGLILEAPRSNVVFTTNDDAGTHNHNLDAVLKQAAGQRVMTPDSLLQQTHPTSYNEVVVIAKRDDQAVEVKGFFIKTTADGKPHSPYIAKRMESHASRLGLPVVSIVEQGAYPTDTIDDYGGKLAVNYNGNRVLLKGYEDTDYEFRLYDERGVPRFASPQDVEGALNFAGEAGRLGIDEAESIRQAYTAADTRRQTPTAHFEADGSVKEVSFRTGYGEAETKVYITRSGFAYRTNLAAQARRNEEMMLSTGSERSYKFGGDHGEVNQALSPYETQTMVEQACAQLDEARAAEVREWFDANRDVRANQWQYHVATSGSELGSRSQELGSYSLKYGGY